MAYPEIIENKKYNKYKYLIIKILCLLYFLIFLL